jgi:hypothetical protein
VTDPVGRLLKTYAEGLEQEPHQPTNINRLEQRVRGTLRQRSEQRKQTVRRLQWGLALAASFALISVGAAYKLGQGPETKTAAVVPAGEWLSTTTGAPQERKFDDGSSVRVESGSSARVQFVQAKGGLVHLDRGAVRLKVKHRDGSTWRVAAGPYEVEAIGTEFVVDWVAGREKPLRVSVTEGTVAVRGPAFRGTRFVSAHQVVEVTGQETASAAPHAVAVDELLPEIAAPEEPGSARVRSNDNAKWRELEAAGKYTDALKAAERRGLSSIYQSASGDDLIVLARAAGNAKRPDVAREALMACRARFSGSSHAAMAAFRLGQSAKGAQAAQWFSTYLKEQPSGGLAREALGRLIEAHQAAGDAVSSRATAERYLKSYPDGPHATLARQALHR